MVLYGFTIADAYNAMMFSADTKTIVEFARSLCPVHAHIALFQPVFTEAAVTEGFCAI